jgi:heme/copper-type cytochrome/quinol oxidase subunit 3
MKHLLSLILFALFCAILSSCESEPLIARDDHVSEQKIFGLFTLKEIIIFSIIFAFFTFLRFYKSRNVKKKNKYDSGCGGY